MASVTTLDTVVDADLISDAATPYSDGWWLQRLYNQLRVQQKQCRALQDRYEGNPPLPYVSDIQRDAVKWFVKKSRTNFERLIVQAVLSRMRVRGLRTAVKGDEAGDADAFAQWTAANMTLVVYDALKMMLSMGRSYIIVGKDADGNLVVTAEDPRLMTAITDPTNPSKVLAALKVFHDDVNDEDVAYLYLPGRIMVARKPRKTAPMSSMDVRFSRFAWMWDLDILGDLGELVSAGRSGAVPELAEVDDNGVVTGGLVPVVQLLNEDGMAEFEPFLEILDRINQQILQRMTIATVQAFRQRAFKGLPRTDPTTGKEIDYNEIFVADPGAVWNIPEGAEIWESGQVDLGPILMAIRDDIKDLAATSSTPLYSITPDAANGSAEGASLQREGLTFKVEAKDDRSAPPLVSTAQLIFKYLGDEQRAQRKGLQIIWAPAERFSMSERANAIAQTKGVIPRFQQLTEIWGMDPDQATRAMSELTDDLILDQMYSTAAAANASTSAGQ